MKGLLVKMNQNIPNISLCGFAGSGYLAAVQKLLELGADPNSKDIEKCSPLHNGAHGTYSALSTNGKGGLHPGTCGSWSCALRDIMAFIVQAS